MKKQKNNLKHYYNSLNKDGEVNTIYKQNNHVGRYYYNKFSLQGMFNEVRSSIIHKKCLDVDFKNSIVTIIIYLAEKYNLKIPNIVKYSKDIENILKQINSDRMTAKKVIISILNGGFSEKYHDDKTIDKIELLKKFIIIRQNVFQEYYKIMKINY